MRYELSDYEWSVIKAMLPNKPRGVARVDDRRILNGICWVLRSGAPWRDLPENYGPHTTCYNRFVRWRRAGIWDRIMDALAAAHDAAVQMIDTTVVRVHQHGSCIAGNKEQHMGRSRGGLTSKIHAVVDANGLPVRLGLTPGEAHDNRHPRPVLMVSRYLMREGLKSPCSPRTGLWGGKTHAIGTFSTEEHHVHYLHRHRRHRRGHSLRSSQRSVCPQRIYDPVGGLFDTGRRERAARRLGSLREMEGRQRTAGARLTSDCCPRRRLQFADHALSRQGLDHRDRTLRRHDAVEPQA